MAAELLRPQSHVTFCEKLITNDGEPKQQSMYSSVTSVSPTDSPMDAIKNFIAHLAICFACLISFPPPHGIHSHRMNSFPIPPSMENADIV